MTISDVWRVALAVLTSLGGGAVIVLALSSWLGKVWANRILEGERAKYAAEMERLRSSLERTNRLLQGEIEKTIFVSKTHFETEFRALEQIWRYISTVRARMAPLRPQFDIVDVRQTQEERLQERFEPFVTAVKELIAATDEQSPFYPKEIYGPLENLINIAVRGSCPRFS